MMLRIGVAAGFSAQALFIVAIAPVGDIAVQGGVMVVITMRGIVMRTIALRAIVMCVIAGPIAAIILPATGIVAPGEQPGCTFLMAANRTITRLRAAGSLAYERRADGRNNYLSDDQQYQQNRTEQDGVMGYGVFHRSCCRLQ